MKSVNMVAIVAGLTAFASVANAAEPVGGTPGHPLPGGRWCGTVGYKGAAPAGQVRRANSGPQPRRTVYLSQEATTFTMGTATDATANVIGPAGTNEDGSRAQGFASSPNIPAEHLEEIRACTAKFFEKYNVEITTEKPTGDNYIKAPIVGSNDELNMHTPTSWPDDWQLAGIAITETFSPGRCEAGDRGLAFIFYSAHGGPGDTSAPSVREALCLTAAHEIGHVIGLEHVILGEDVMSYIFGVEKTFTNVDAPCGTSPGEEQTCMCTGQPYQNNALVMYENLGPNDQEPPTLVVTSPVAGDSVGPGFEVKLDSTDNVKPIQAELRINGELVASDAFAPFLMKAPSNLPVGPVTIEVSVVDKSANYARQTIAVVVEPGCSADPDCDDGERCVNGACLGDLGSDCARSTDCADGICAAPLGENDKFCTRACSEASACPSGFACSGELGGADKCVPAGDSGGCGCRTGGADGRSGAAGLSLATFLGILGLAAFRRRRS